MILSHVIKEVDGSPLFKIHLIVEYLQKVLFRKSGADLLQMRDKRFN